MPLQFQSPSAPPRLTLPSVETPGSASQTQTRRRVDASIVGAALATIGLSLIPWAGIVTYPLRLMVTFVHEGFHALAALLTGGSVHAIQLMPNGSGVTLTSGGFGAVISSAGYLGATLYGALLLALLRRGVPGSRLLAITAGFVGLLALGGLLNPFTLFAGLLIAGLLALGARRLPRKGADWLAGFVGVQCVLNALFDLKTLFLLSVSSGVPTDAMNMQRATLIPAVVWSVLWIVAAAGILWAVLLKPALRERR